MDTQDKQVMKVLQEFEKDLDNEFVKQLELNDIDEGLKADILKIYPDIDDSEMIEIGEIVVVMAGAGIEAKEMLKVLQEIGDFKLISPEMFGAKKAGEALAEELKKLTINVKHLENNYQKPIKSHNDRFVRRSNNKSKW